MKTSAAHSAETSRANAQHAPKAAQSYPAVEPLQFAVNASYGSTNVDWETADLGGDTVGISMEATKLHRSSLGKHANLKGSPPAANQQKTLMSLLPTNPKLAKPNKYIKGHLLNHNIGGPGKDFNMFPITGSANGTHLYSIEATVKEWVSSGAEVNYKVEVNNRDSNLALGAKAGWVTSSFDCRAKNLDTGKEIAASVPSVLGVKSVAGDINADHISIYADVGSKGVFAFAYDRTENADDPMDVIEVIAAKLEIVSGIAAGDWLEVLVGVVFFDDLADADRDAVERTVPFAKKAQSDMDWGTVLGM